MAQLYLVVYQINLLMLNAGKCLGEYFFLGLKEKGTLLWFNSTLK